MFALPFKFAIRNSQFEISSTPYASLLYNPPMHIFDPQHAARLDSPERHKWLPPHKIIEIVGARDGDTIVDFGCGTCFLTMPLAKAFPNSTVYGVDISDEMLRMCAEKNPPRNLKLIKFEGSASLPAGVADHVVTVNTMHELAGDKSAIKTLADVSKTGATLTIVDWKKEPMEMGPPVEERLAEDEVAAVLADDFSVTLVDAEAFVHNYVIKLVRK